MILPLSFLRYLQILPSLSSLSLALYLGYCGLFYHEDCVNDEYLEEAVVNEDDSYQWLVLPNPRFNYYYFKMMLKHLYLLYY